MRRLCVSEVKEAAWVHVGGQDLKGSLSQEGSEQAAASMLSQTVHLWHPFLPQIKVQLLVRVFASKIIWLRKKFTGPGSFWMTSRNTAIGAAQHPPGIQL